MQQHSPHSSISSSSSLSHPEDGDPAYIKLIQSHSDDHNSPANVSHSRSGSDESENHGPRRLSLNIEPDIPLAEGEADFRTTGHDKNSVETEKGSLTMAKHRSYLHTHFKQAEPGPLVLPTPPNDEEKVAYTRTKRGPLMVATVFSSLSLSVGMWLFVRAAPAFYFFGVLAGLLQIYLIISLIVGLSGRDFDMSTHDGLRELTKRVPVDTLPCIDIFLPCCNEPLKILENTYRHVRALRWPQGKLNVHVLDDGGLAAVKALAIDHGFKYICRDDRPRLRKAGNLRWAFQRTSGDFFVIFDADFCPRPDFLEESMVNHVSNMYLLISSVCLLVDEQPYHLANPSLAILQTPQFFRITDSQTWVEQGAGAVQELFYRFVQVNRDRFGAAICVGTCAIYRREALIATGGTAEIGYSEDVHTGFYALNRGWQVKYVPLNLALGICPDTMRAFFSQQSRWCMGSTTLLSTKDFWTSRLSLMQKVCFMSGMMYYAATALSIFLNPLPGILLIWCRPQFILYYNLFFVVPSLVHTVVVMRLWAKHRRSFAVQFMQQLQSFAHLSALKDKVLGSALAWIPTGDPNAHRNTKYRDMRLLAIFWTFSYESVFIAGVAYRMLQGVGWWNFVPLFVFNLWNLFINHRLLLAQ